MGILQRRSRAVFVPLAFIDAAEGLSEKLLRTQIAEAIAKPVGQKLSEYDPVRINKYLDTLIGAKFVSNSPHDACSYMLTAEGEFLKERIIPILHYLVKKGPEHWQAIVLLTVLMGLLRKREWITETEWQNASGLKGIPFNKGRDSLFVGINFLNKNHMEVAILADVLIVKAIPGPTGLDTGHIKLYRLNQSHKTALDALKWNWSWDHDMFVPQKEEVTYRVIEEFLKKEEEAPTKIEEGVIEEFLENEVPIENYIVEGRLQNLEKDNNQLEEVATDEATFMKIYSPYLEGRSAEEMSLLSEMFKKKGSVGFMADMFADHLAGIANRQTLLVELNKENQAALTQVEKARFDLLEDQQELVSALGLVKEAKQKLQAKQTILETAQEVNEELNDQIEALSW